MEVIGGFFGLLIVAVVVVAIFFICRSLFLWYWKLDKIEEHLSAIRVEIEKKNGKIFTSCFHVFWKLKRNF